MAARCPSCHRPVALTRPRCLYCGAALPATAPSGSDAAATTEIPAGEERSLVVIDVGGADAAAVAAGLGLSRLDASQRMSRGGLDLWRIASTNRAEEEAGRLRAAGLTAILIPEAEVRESRRPVATAGGRPSDGTLELRVDGGKVRVSGDDLLVVVQGPITRERPPSAETRRVRLATLEAGYRIHLHRHEDPRPLELDPDAFDFGPAGVAQSSLLTLREWVEALAPRTTVDDSFRRIPPALAPGTANDPMTEVLAGRSRASRNKQGSTVPLDNLEQFRFYSAWRGAVERRRA
jgi:hypothetical protein